MSHLGKPDAQENLQPRDPNTGKKETLGVYELVEKLGAGGMACVYKGKHMHLRNSVAIKVLHPHMAQNPSVRRRFIKEARIQANITNENIIKVTDILQEGESVGIVMDWVEGDDLHKYLRVNGALSDKGIENLFLPILKGVGYFHKKGVAHRDLKPENIMLSGADRIPKIMDFGIAKILNATHSETMPGATMGTPSYLAPEQIQPLHEIDHRVDIYALGIILFRMLTGRLPFEKKEHEQVNVLLQAHLHKAPPKLREVKDDVNPQFEEVVAKALAKDPSERYESCEAFANGIRAVLGLPLEELLAASKTNPLPNFQSSEEPIASHKPLPLNGQPPLPSSDELAASQETLSLDEESPSSSTGTFLPNIPKKRASGLGWVVWLGGLAFILVVGSVVYHLVKKAPSNKTMSPSSAKLARTEPRREVPSQGLGVSIRSSSSHLSANSKKGLTRRSQMPKRQPPARTKTAVITKPKKKQKLYPFGSCLRCVSRYFRRVTRTLGFSRYAGFCNKRDVLRAGRACGVRCSYNYRYFTRSYLRQRFKISSSSERRLPANAIKRCQSYVRSGRIAMGLKRLYSKASQRPVQK